MDALLEVINPFIGEYVPAIVNAVLMASYAAGCGRELNETECDAIIENINEISTQFIESYTAELKKRGEDLTDDEAAELRDIIAENILITAHFLLKDATEELKLRIWAEREQDPPGTKTGAKYYA